MGGDETVECDACSMEVRVASCALRVVRGDVHRSLSLRAELEPQNMGAKSISESAAQLSSGGESAQE